MPQLFQVPAWPDLPRARDTGGWQAEAERWMTELIHILDLTLLTSGGEAAAAISAQAGGSHALLSAVHTDTLAAGIARGAVIVGNSSLKWAALAHPGAADRVLQSSALDTAWSGFALAIEAASAINQDLTTDSEPLFAALRLGSVLANLRGTSADGTDNQRLDIVPHGGGAYSFGRGAGIAMWGNEGPANLQGAMMLGSGQPGTTGTYDGMVLLYANGALAAQWNRSQQFLLPDGTAAAPTLSFINEATLGLRRVSAGVIGVNHLQIVDNGTVVTLSRVA